MAVRTIYSWNGSRKDSRSNAIFGSPMVLILNRYAPILGVGFFREFSEKQVLINEFSVQILCKEFQLNILKLEKLYVCKNEVWKMPT